MTHLSELSLSFNQNFVVVLIPFFNHFFPLNLHPSFSILSKKVVPFQSADVPLACLTIWPTCLLHYSYYSRSSSIDGLIVEPTVAAILAIPIRNSSLDRQIRSIICLMITKMGFRQELIMLRNQVVASMGSFHDIN